jgi:chromosome segregation ATPase
MCGFPNCSSHSGIGRIPLCGDHQDLSKHVTSSSTTSSSGAGELKAELKKTKDKLEKLQNEFSVCKSTAPVVDTTSAQSEQVLQLQELLKTTRALLAAEKQNVTDTQALFDSAKTKLNEAQADITQLRIKLGGTTVAVGTSAPSTITTSSSTKPFTECFEAIGKGLVTNGAVFVQEDKVVKNFARAVVASFTKVTGERDQFEKAVTKVTGERDQFEKDVTKVTGERDQFEKDVAALKAPSGAETVLNF